MTANDLAVEASGLPDGEAGSTAVTERVAAVSEFLSLWLLIGIVAWVQFPFGSNRAWAWSLLSLLVSATWLVWVPAAVFRAEKTVDAARRVAVPAIVLIAVVAWAFIQAAPFTPKTWHHVIWSVYADGTGHSVAGAVSMNPFVTVMEAMKLATYLAAGWLAFWLARSHDNARRIFIAVVVIGTAYAVYGMFLSAIGSGQTKLLEGLAPPYGTDVTGGFISKNNFATFDGIALVASLALLADTARGTVIATRGFRQLAISLIQLVLGRAVFNIIASIILFVALLLSNSKAGLLATLGGLFVLFVFGIILAARRGTVRWAILASAITLGSMAVLFSISGDSMQARFDQLVETRGKDLRPLFWDAAVRAIDDYPLQGSGLGTFRDSYNLYADRFEPYIVDRAHDDYLELALGLGIPVAAACVGALAWLTLMCAGGVLRRRRRRLYALAAVSAATIVGLHSLVDFSLQIPAVAILFAVVMGVGLGQSEGRAERNELSQAESVAGPRMNAGRV